MVSFTDSKFELEPLFTVELPRIEVEKSSEKGSEKSSEKILKLIEKDGKISASQMAKEIGISARAVEKQLAKLKDENKIERIGSAIGGEWVIKKQL